MVKAEKKQKHFSTPVFKSFYKFWSPYRVKISIFEKKNFRQFLLKKFISHNFTLTKAEKTQKKVSTPFFKNFRKFWSPYKVKAAKTQKHLSTTFSKHFYKFWSPYKVKAQKKQKHFQPHFLKTFTSSDPPIGEKFQFFKKKFSDNFFYSKNMFHKISHWLKPKKRKKKFQPHFS